MRTLYNAALLPARAASVVFGAWPRGTPAAALERDQRLGRELPKVEPGAVWIHGASVGEARIAGAVARELRRRRPGQPIVASAVTATGRSLLPAPPAIDGAFFLPLDFPAVQRRTFDALSPAMLVLVETELWPNLLDEAHARRIPVVVVNGRLAPQRLQRYRLFAGLYAPLLREIEAIGVAGPDEEERFRALGVSTDRVTVTGNVKFDLTPPASTAAELRARCGIGAQRPAVAAGSTGPGEDEIVLAAFADARRTIPELLLVLAPRHPERFNTAAEEAKRRGFSVGRVTSGTAAGGSDVLLVDTIGELAALYGVATSAFVGGTLVPVGGHNLLEPLAAGVPVLFGPHTEHVAEIARTLLTSGCGERVEHGAALGRAWTALATQPDERARRAAIGGRVLDAHRGATGRSVELILNVLDGEPAGAHR